MRTLVCLLLAVGVGSSVPGPDASVADRVAKQNALFEEYYQAVLKSAPLQATAIGDYRYNTQLDDGSLAGLARQHAEGDAFLARLRAIPTAGMPEGDLLSHELLERQLARADVSYELKNYEMSINQQGGIQTALADLPLSVPFDSVQHYEDYIARLHQIPLRRSSADHRRAARRREGRPDAAQDSSSKSCRGSARG
jgi:uncharacterized protein (DUF885 family)